MLSLRRRREHQQDDSGKFAPTERRRCTHRRTYYNTTVLTASAGPLQKPFSKRTSVLAPAPPSRRQEALDYHAQGPPPGRSRSPYKAVSKINGPLPRYTPGVRSRASRSLNVRRTPTSHGEGQPRRALRMAPGTRARHIRARSARQPGWKVKGIRLQGVCRTSTLFDLEVGSVVNPDDVIRFSCSSPRGAANLEDIRTRPRQCFYIGTESCANPDRSGLVPRRQTRHPRSSDGRGVANALTGSQRKDIATITIVFCGARPARGDRDLGRALRALA